MDEHHRPNLLFLDTLFNTTKYDDH